MTSLQARWGSRIKTLRQEKGLSVTALARLAEIDQGQLSRVENGKEKLGDDGRIRLAAALGVRVEDVFTYPDTTADAPAKAAS